MGYGHQKDDNTDIHVSIFREEFVAYSILITAIHERELVMHDLQLKIHELDIVVRLSPVI